MSSNVKTFPGNPYKRLKARYGARMVPCMVSGRYLLFPEQSAGHLGGGEFIPVDVMTMGGDDKPRKLCEMVITREDLLAALTACKAPVDQAGN